MPSLAVLVVLALLVGAWPLAESRPKYVALLPNGDRVPGSMALGHVNANGSGALNVFGRHFIWSARAWDVELCKDDSDGDGQTNGQELGDPCCEWVPGDVPRFTDGISHPGDASQTANESRWRNLTCPNVTKLSMASASADVRCTQWNIASLVLLGAVAFLRD